MNGTNGCIGSFAWSPTWAVSPWVQLWIMDRILHVLTSNETEQRRHGCCERVAPKLFTRDGGVDAGATIGTMRGGRRRAAAADGGVIMILALCSAALRRCGALPILPVTQRKAVDAHPLDCHNKLDSSTCDAWASGGECDKNPSFMRHSCALSCGCIVDRTCQGVTPPAKGIGGITAMFERAEKMLELGPTVHSRDPFVVTFDRFVTEAECAAFISSTKSHFERSLAGDVVSPVRTSKQAWCQSGIASECYTHPLTRRVAERVANVTGVPVENAEFFQVLRYEPGQFYKVRCPWLSG